MPHSSDPSEVNATSLTQLAWHWGLSLNIPMLIFQAKCQPFIKSRKETETKILPNPIPRIQRTPNHTAFPNIKQKNLFQPSLQKKMIFNLFSTFQNSQSSWGLLPSPMGFSSLDFLQISHSSPAIQVDGSPAAAHWIPRAGCDRGRRRWQCCDKAAAGRGQGTSLGPGSSQWWKLKMKICGFMMGLWRVVAIKCDE